MRAISRPGFCVVIAVLCASLAACAETSQTAPETADASAPAPIVKRQGVSLADATVALVSLDGAPDAAGDDFRKALTQQFSARRIVAADARKARYLLRFYLAARPEDGGASLTYVIDVFDPHRARLARLGDEFDVKGSGDAWSLMSAEALDSVAGQAADEIAAFLSNTPEAKPAEALSYAE